MIKKKSEFFFTSHMVVSKNWFDTGLIFFIQPIGISISFHFICKNYLYLLFTAKERIKNVIFADFTPIPTSTKYQVK